MQIVEKLLDLLQVSFQDSGINRSVSDSSLTLIPPRPPLYNKGLKLLTSFGYEPILRWFSSWKRLEFDTSFNPYKALTREYSWSLWQYSTSYQNWFITIFCLGLSLPKFTCWLAFLMRMVLLLNKIFTYRGIEIVKV